MVATRIESSIRLIDFLFWVLASFIFLFSIFPSEETQEHSNVARNSITKDIGGAIDTTT